MGPSLIDPATSLFTTSDGLYSFVMPATWTATPVPPNDAPDYGVPISRTAYSIRDAAGTELAQFQGGIPGDGAAVPHPGHVLLDSEELPALSNQVGSGPAEIAFVFDYYPDYVTGGLEYNARLHQGVLSADGTYSQFFPLISVGTNGQVSFTATFDETRFADPADATAWLGTEEYAALRAMLCSFTVNG